MKSPRQRSQALRTVPCVLAAMGLAVAVQAQAATASRSESQQATRATSHNGTEQSAQDRVNDAVQVVKDMQRDPNVAQLLHRAEGVFIVPHYGKGGFIVGGQGGGGVLMVRHAEHWSDPAFYSIGGGSVGAQAGGEAGAIGMLLMTRKAVHKFENSTNTWSLNANAGLTVVTYSGKAQAETGKGDVILWSDTKGLYGGLTASVTDITPNPKMDAAYYGRHANAREILSGSLTNPSADALRRAAMTRVALR